MKTKIVAAALALAIGSQAAAHPTGVPYSTRGECEEAYAHASKFDRNRLDQIPGVTPGEAQRTFRDIFRCEYDAEEDAWFIVQVGPFPAF